MSKIPSGWTVATIQDLASYEPAAITDGPFGSALKRSHYAEAGARVVRLGNLGDGQFLDEDKAYVPFDHYATLKRHEVRPGDILVAALGDPLGRACCSPNDLGPAIVKADCFRFRPNPELNASLIVSFLNAPQTRDLLAELSHGLGRVRINLSDLKNLQVPVPPAPEQNRIDHKLSGLRTRSARARYELELIPKLIEQYKQAILTKAFSGELTNSQPRAHFIEKPLSEALQSTFYGPRFSREAYQAGGTITLRTTDFDEHGKIQPRNPPAVAVTNSEYEKWGLRDGDLLVTRTGSIGKCAVYDQSIGPALPSAYLIRVRLNLQIVRPRFVLLFMLSERGKNQLLKGITAVTQPNINASVIECLMLPVPPLSVQDSILAQLNHAFSWIDRLTAQHTRAVDLLPKLDQAILAKAFRGELVPQDPNDEPASVLLERLREGHRVQDTPKRGRKSSVPKSPREKAVMTKSRQDEDVKNKPYLANIVREMDGRSNVEDLFKRSDLSVTDFYKQLAWEVDQGHILDQDNKTLQAA